MGMGFCPCATGCKEFRILVGAKSPADADKSPGGSRQAGRARLVAPDGWREMGRTSAGWVAAGGSRPTRRGWVARDASRQVGDDLADANHPTTEREPEHEHEREQEIERERERNQRILGMKVHSKNDLEEVRV